MSFPNYNTRNNVQDEQKEKEEKGIYENKCNIPNRSKLTN